MTEYTRNRQHAEKLTKLMTEYPDYPVMVMIDTDDITNDYAWMAGYMYEPSLEEVVVGHDEKYYSKEHESYDDCYNYYGDKADDWTDEELEQRASVIPWEKVIAIYVGAT